MMYWQRPEPTLTYGLRGLTIPELLGNHSLMDLSMLETYARLPAFEATSLIRAARLYQDGLWLCESEPSMSWLMLVSAVETIANCWRSSQDPAVARLRASKSAFVEYLENLGVTGLIERVAEEFSDSLGTTKKFTDFLLEYMPEPPATRPELFGQVEWSELNLKKIMRLVYSYRSKALHDGQPFPAPMCESPVMFGGDSPPMERPIALASSGMGGTWLAKDIPMFLHTFEYIVRKSILSWWKSAAQAGEVNHLTNR